MSSPTVNRKIISKIVASTEDVVGGGTITKAEIKKIIDLSQRSQSNLGVYRGMLCIHSFYRFKELPDRRFNALTQQRTFLQCASLLEGERLPATEIGRLFLKILSISDREVSQRDMLLGAFYGSLWPVMNNPKNFRISVDYGVEMMRSAFSLDKSFPRKTKIKKAHVINMAGSGKKEIKLLNISSMTAVTLAAIGKRIGVNIVVAKTTSRATSSITGSSDIFELVGVNLDNPANEMIDMSRKTRLGIFDIDRMVPALNHIYDGRLYDVQVFAGLVGGAAVVNPIDADLIDYGLTRGSSKLCLAILSKLYPNKNIIVLQGKDERGRGIMDQISIASDTEIAERINGKVSSQTVTPRKFGFRFESMEQIKTRRNSTENTRQFIRLLGGKGEDHLNQIVAMGAALDLYGLGIVKNLKIGANLALEAIRSAAGIDVLRSMVFYSHGDIGKYTSMVNANLQ